MVSVLTALLTRAALVAMAASLVTPPALVASQCTNLLVDNYAQLKASNTNSFGGYVADDGTMTSMTVNGTNLIVKAKSVNSYFYETGFCAAKLSNTTAKGWKGMSLSVTAPTTANVTMAVNLQTGCTTIKNNYITVTITKGTTQALNLDFSTFPGANVAAVSAVSFEGFVPLAADITFSPIYFYCATTSSTASSMSSSAPVSSTSAPVSSTTSASSTASRTSSSAAVSSTTSAFSSSTVPSSSSTSTHASSSSAFRSSTGSSTSAASSTISASSTSSAFSSSTSQSSTVPPTATASPTSSPGSCDLIVEDMFDPQRLNFLGYNAIVPPGASGHDGTMKSAIMSGQRLSLTRAGTGAYLYTLLNCIDVTKYAGVSFPVSIPAGGTVSVSLEYSSSAGCGSTSTSGSVNLVTGMAVPANGVETVVSIPFSKFTGLNTKYVSSIVFSGFTSASAYRLGAIRLYCSGSALTSPAIPVADVLPTIPPMQKPYPVNTAGALVIENFVSRSTTANALGGWHGGEIPVTYNTNSTATFKPADSEQTFYTQFVGFPCSDLSKYKNSYLHVVASFPATQNFEIVLEQQNAFCDTTKSPSPATFSQVSAAVYRVGTSSDIYIPLAHFNLAAWNRVGSLAFRGFRTTQSVLFSRVEILDSVPTSVNLPGKQPEAQLIYECTVPNTVAFGIDDGDPALAPTVFKILKDANVKATFFLLGNPLLDASNGLAAIYKQAAADGHQIGFHSYSHPYFPTLVQDWEVDRQLNLALNVISNVTGAQSTYFRSPFGVMDSRLRLRLANRNMKIIQWSIDVEDYLWGTSSTPQKQLDAFNRDLKAGGSIVVTHYLYNSTAVYLKDFINAAKAAGKKVVRIDQCLGDPSAPPIV